MASKIKLFNKISVGKKHKAQAAVKPVPQTINPIINPVEQHIEDCVEYSLPPDCDSDDGVYCEPADSLNTGSTSASSTQSRNPSTKEASDSEPNTLSKSHSSLVTPTPCTRCTDSSCSSAQDNPTPPTAATTTTTSAVTTIPHSHQAMDNSNSMLTSQLESMHIVNGAEQLSKRDNMDSSLLLLGSCSSADDNSAVYMNDGQIQAAKASMNRPAVPTPKLTPDIDPRNFVFPNAGNEYESPWDLESELKEVANQINNPSSPLTPTSSANVQSQKSVAGDKQVTSPSSSSSLKQKHSIRGEHMHGLKVDYDSKKGPSHKVRQPSVQRRPSPTTPTTPTHQPSRSPHAPSAVLVEGEWREAKPSLPLASPLSPELSSSPLIISQTEPIARSGSNAASNYIYDKKGSDSEINAMLRYPDDQPKVPRAQPRISLSSSSHLEEDENVYQNFSDPKTSAARALDTDCVYDDPWNVEQVQQDIFDQLERQKHKVASSEPKQRRSSGDLTTADKKKQSDMYKNSRIADPPNETGSYRSEDPGAKRLLSASSSSASDKFNKLSPRAFISPPRVPQAAPGQAHASKPVLVVHKTNGTFVNRTDRKGSLSSSRPGSLRKNYITETTYLSTRNHTFHFSGSYSAPSTPGDAPHRKHRVGLNINKNVTLTQQPWYHGAIQRHIAEELLIKHPDGSFLIRESSNTPRDKTLSLKNLTGFIHIKIAQQPDGTVVLGQFSQPFDNIMEMVEYYSHNKVNIKGAEHTYLEIPVLREQ